MKKIVTIGGGTGHFALLSGLKKYPVELSAIVAMSDDGGSTGQLRDEFGVLPPGDLRQCLIALSSAPQVMRKLMGFRFEKGDLKGHNFGNIFISTLEMVTGSLDKALDLTGSILNIKGRVIPVTLDKVQLVAELNNGKVIQGEDALGDYQLVSRFGVKKMYLSPKGDANPKALTAIKEADMIVVGPGDIYTSLIPNFLVNNIGKAVIRSKAKKVFVVNLMNKHGHADDFDTADYVHLLEKYLGNGKVFDTIIYNTKMPAQSVLKKYADEGEPVILNEAALKDYELIGANLLAGGLAKLSKGDKLHRVLIRHNPDALAELIMKCLA